jgi:hypothetical protein
MAREKSGAAVELPGRGEGKGGQDLTVSHLDKAAIADRQGLPGPGALLYTVAQGDPQE